MEKERLLAEIRKQVEALADQEVEGYDTEIFRDGFLDSLNVIHLITWLEKKYSFSIEAFEVSPRTFSTISRIADFVLKKTAPDDDR